MFLSVCFFVENDCFFLFLDSFLFFGCFPFLTQKNKTLVSFELLAVCSWIFFDCVLHVFLCCLVFTEMSNKKPVVSLSCFFMSCYFWL